MSGTRKINPTSLQNLKPGQSPGRKKLHVSLKRGRSVTVTDEGWKGFQDLAKSFDFSVSEFVDQIGLGNLSILETETLEAFQDALDLANARSAMAEAKEKGVKPLEQVLTEMELEA
jgi:hypothetical protein